MAAARALGATRAAHAHAHGRRVPRPARAAPRAALAPPPPARRGAGSASGAHGGGGRRALQLVVLEADNVLADLHLNAHLPALNQALKQHGAVWEADKTLYQSCLRMPHDGSFESVARAMFLAKGWPAAAGEDSEARAEFCAKLHASKRKAFVAMLEAGEVQLRTGVQELVDAAAAAGVQVAVLAGTGSHPEDMAAQLLVRHLGPSYAALLPIFDARFKREQFQSIAGEVVEPCVAGDDDEPESADLMEDVLGLAARDQRRSLAADAARNCLTGGIIIDNSLGAAPSVRQSAFRALADMLEVEPSACVALVGSVSAAQAATAAGFVAAAVRAGVAARGEFPGATAIYDGCGPGGGATLSRLEALINQ